ncbi:MAG TPA: PleD family two-component system response regulator [Alphaproteobacteria bacterium]|jgi:two-component system cell cycle response regulator
MPARVLVVDDVPANVKILEAKLTAEYFEVLTASHGRAALEVALAEQPDIILLDVMMPEMDGFEVCRRLKADPRTVHIPVVMVTALSDIGDRVTGLEAGADDFLTKPVNDLILLSRVKSLVRLKTSMDEWRLREATSGQFGGDLPGLGLLSDEDLQGRVLVIESDPFSGEKICHLLEQKKCTTVLAPTAREGTQRCDSEDFDLVIVSLYLEDGDGLRLCSHLRSNERTRRLPILLVIEPEEMGGLVKGFEIGVNDYLFRPIEGNELWARVRTQMRRKRYQDLLRDNYQRSLSLALTDSLTGLYNRRYLTAHLQSMIERSHATAKPLSLFMLDIDHFKRINDTYGHACGDEVLCVVAGLISHNLREFDLTARIGGEEFVVVMPDTPIAAAEMVADRMRKMVSETDMPLRGAATAPVEPGKVTVSIGVAALCDGESGDDLLRRADQALYGAKDGGRNLVVLAPARVAV